MNFKRFYKFNYLFLFFSLMQFGFLKYHIVQSNSISVSGLTQKEREKINVLYIISDSDSQLFTIQGHSYCTGLQDKKHSNL